MLARMRSVNKSFVDALAGDEVTVAARTEFNGTALRRATSPEVFRKSRRAIVSCEVDWVMVGDRIWVKGARQSLAWRKLLDSVQARERLLASCSWAERMISFGIKKEQVGEAGLLLKGRLRHRGGARSFFRG